MAAKKRRKKRAANELSDSLDFLIRDTRLRLYKYIESRIVGLNIPLRVWFPLRVLYGNEGITQRELGQILGFGDAHAGVIVAVMVRRRLVNRQPSPVDGRRIDLYLTAAGKTAARTTFRLMRSVNRQIVKGFSATEAKTIKTLLARARENLDLP